MPKNRTKKSKSGGKSKSRSRSRSKPKGKSRLRSRSRSRSPRLQARSRSPRLRLQALRSIPNSKLRDPVPIADMSPKAQADAAKALKSYMDTTDLKEVLTTERAAELAKTASEARAIPPTRRNVEDLIMRSIRNAQVDGFYMGYKLGLEHEESEKSKKDA